MLVLAIQMPFSLANPKTEKVALAPRVLDQTTNIATDRKLSQGTPACGSERGAASSRTRRAQMGICPLDGSWHSAYDSPAVRYKVGAPTAGFHRKVGKRTTFSPFGSLGRPLPCRQIAWGLSALLSRLRAGM